MIRRLFSHRHQAELHARVVRRLRADLRETREHAVELAEKLVQAIRRADSAEAELAELRTEMGSAHQELIAENRQLKAEVKRLREAKAQQGKQLWDAPGYRPSDLAVIDAGGEQALAAIEKATRELPKVATT